MIEILRTYIFNNRVLGEDVQHLPEDSEEDLLRDASIVIESIVGTPVARVVKSRSTQRRENKVNNELIDLVKKSGDFTIVKSCQTYYFEEGFDKIFDRTKHTAEKVLAKEVRE